MELTGEIQQINKPVEFQQTQTNETRTRITGGAYQYLGGRTHTLGNAGNKKTPPPPPPPFSPHGRNPPPPLVRPLPTKPGLRGPPWAPPSPP